jgi:hypothetical protein
MNEETLQTLLTQLRDKTRSALVSGSGCIPLARLVEALSNDALNAEERSHLADCTVCQRTASNVRRAQLYRANADGNLYDAATGQPFAFEEPLGFPEPNDAAKLQSPRRCAGPSDYERIREDNLKEYGQGTRHLAFLGRLYTDRTHFLLELLQNAEDAAGRSADLSSPKEVWFELFRNRLELRHNGRPFDEKDVRGICGVGEGTGAEDLTRIGKFGIGFKSVYAYTSSPEIHSGTEHFSIEHYVRPHLADFREPGNPWTTLFVFPFNHPDVEAEQAFDEIARRLETLSGRTLLFLRHIRTIHWQVEGRSRGTYQRDPTEVGRQIRQVKVIDQKERKPEVVEEWLVFEQPLRRPGLDRKVRVEAAFRLDKSEETGEKRIVRVHDSHLVVFFPTEKETHLGFLIQGPYRTTPARDNIPKDDDWNRELIDETAKLVAQALPTLRDRNLLTIGLLEALPINSVDFQPDSMFRPVFDQVRDALKTQDLLPSHDGGFVSAARAKLARGAALRDLLSHDQLGNLLSAALRDLLSHDRLGNLPGVSEPQWVAEAITHERTPVLWAYLREELQVQEIAPASFVGFVTPAFLDRQPDEWMARFYVFLDQQRGLWSHGIPLRRRPFIRREDGEHVPAFRDDQLPNVYLPPEEETSFPIVKRSIAAESGALAFLGALGLKKPDVFAEVRDKILPKYARWEYATSKIVEGSGPPSNEENWQDIRKILRAVKEAGYTDRQAFENEVRYRAWVRSKSATDGISFYNFPECVYVPSPALKMYFAGNGSAWFLADDYSQEQRDELAKLHELAKLPCLCQTVRVTRREADDHSYVAVTDERGWHERGVDGFDPNCQIAGLEHALKTITSEKAAFVWNKLLVPNRQQLRGIVESSSKQTFEHPKREQKLSSVGKLAMEFSWLPDRSGTFHKPADLSLDELPDEFERNEALAVALQMRSPPELVRIAREWGLEQEDIDFLRKNRKAFAKFRKEIEEVQKRGSPPEQQRERAELDEAADGGRKPESGGRTGAESRDGTGHQHEDTGGRGGQSDSDQAEGEQRASGREKAKPAQQMRLVSYTVPRPSASGAQPETAPLEEDDWHGLGQRGVERVAEEEKRQHPGREVRVMVPDEPGYDTDLALLSAGKVVVKIMPPNHPGYDIEVWEDGNRERYIEVKSLREAWGTCGVGMTPTQFENAQQHGTKYWLYVVERVESPDGAITRIHDPAHLVTRFQFDDGWKPLGQ